MFIHQIYLNINNFKTPSEHAIFTYSLLVNERSWAGIQYIIKGSQTWDTARVN